MDDERRDGAIPDELSIADAIFINPQRFKSYITKLMRGQLEKSLGITESLLFFVIVLDDEKGMSLKELSVYAGVDKSLTTRAVRYLMDLGYVINDKGPGREYSIKLTEKGLEARKKGKEVVKKTSDIITAGLTDEERRMMGIILAKLVKNMENYS